MIKKISFKFDFENKYTVQNPFALGFLAEKFKFEHQEHFGYIALDSGCHVRGIEILTIGTENQTPIRPELLFKNFFSQKKYHPCVSIILFHNHPSGSVLPSRDDWGVVSSMMNAGKILGISILDSVIFAGGHVVSMRHHNNELFEN